MDESGQSPAGTAALIADGRLGAADGRASVRFERVLPDPPEQVWRSLTEPQRLEQWFPSDIVAESWEPGARLSFVFTGEGAPTISGTVLASERPRLLEYSWGEDTLRFELAPTGAQEGPAAGGTRLTLVDTMEGRYAARNAAGWQICLEMLLDREPADEAWRGLFDQYAAAFEPQLGPQDGPPSGFDEI